MSIRIQLDGEPSIQYSELAPRLKVPAFALFNHGRQLFPQYAVCDAIARRNRLRWHSCRTLGDSTYKVTFTHRRPALEGSELFHVPVAEMTFKIKEPRK
jgi:hypothetical protein